MRSGKVIFVNEADGFSYVPVGEDKAYIVRYWGDETRLVIPETLDRRTVIGVGHRNCPLASHPLDTLTLPESVIYLEQPAEGRPIFAQTVILYPQMRSVKTFFGWDQDGVEPMWNFTSDMRTFSEHLVILGDEVMPTPLGHIEGNIYVPQALLEAYQEAPA